jgi:hypothetical protein
VAETVPWARGKHQLCDAYSKYSVNPLSAK